MINSRKKDTIIINGNYIDWILHENDSLFYLKQFNSKLIFHTIPALIPTTIDSAKNLYTCGSYDDSDDRDDSILNSEYSYDDDLLPNETFNEDNLNPLIFQINTAMTPHNIDSIATFLPPTNPKYIEKVSSYNAETGLIGEESNDDNNKSMSDLEKCLNEMDKIYRENNMYYSENSDIDDDILFYRLPDYKLIETQNNIIIDSI
mmetsp:Transcript_14676/g.18032  ORF Transcript_14676/g.18032 Transcript_14676/m.18032 type:complete len:204 (+) Transcript_14676:57-668(+)